jgi:hypothetical protein
MFAWNCNRNQILRSRDSNVYNTLRFTFYPFIPKIKQFIRSCRMGWNYDADRSKLKTFHLVYG